MYMIKYMKIFCPYSHNNVYLLAIIKLKNHLSLRSLVEPWKKRLS